MTLPPRLEWGAGFLRGRRPRQLCLLDDRVGVLHVSWEHLVVGFIWRLSVISRQFTKGGGLWPQLVCQLGDTKTDLPKSPSLYGSELAKREIYEKLGRGSEVAFTC